MRGGRDKSPPGPLKAGETPALREKRGEIRRSSSEKKAGSRAARRVLQVLKFMGTGEILEWKSRRQVAEALGLNLAEAYGALEDLCAEGLCEKSELGYRQSANGLSFFAVQAQEAVAKAVYRAGFR